MTRSARPRPTAPPLAVTLRQALAQGWHTLDALDAMAPARGSSDARRAVHEALRTLRGEGCTLEERVGRAGVEVRLGAAAPRYTLSPETIAEMGGPAEAAATLADEEGEVVDLDAFEREARGEDAPAPPCEPPAPVALTLPAPRPDDGTGDLDADDREAARAAIQRDLDAEPPCDPDSFEGLTGMRLCLGCSHPAYLHTGGPVGGQCLAQEGRGSECGCVAWAEPNTGTRTRAPKGPGPGSRCAVCARPYARHADATGAPYAGPEGHPFTPKPRGRPRVAALDAPPVESASAESGGAEPETTRGGSEETSDDASEAEQVGPTDGGDGAEIPPLPPAHKVEGEPRVHDAGTYQAAAQGYAAVGRHDTAGAPESAASVAQWAGDARRVGGSDDASTTRGDRPTGRSGVGHQAAPRQAVARKPRVRHEAAHPVAAQGGADAAADDARSAPMVEKRREAVKRCRPPRCHADDIHVPSAVRSFQRPLCERHRAWVEGAGGTLAAGGLAGVVEQVRDGAKETV